MSSHRYRRMVIGLPQGMGNQPAVRAAVELAEFLDIELLATFVADPALLELAGSSAGRELRILDQHWQPIDLARIPRDLDEAANLARSRFAESVGHCSIKTNFDVIAGAQEMASLIRADDIIAIVEPGHPAERITRQFTGLLDAAFETAAAILVVPRLLVRTKGPILALAAGPEDASIRVALEIANALKERLIVLAHPGASPSPEIIADAKQLGVQIELVTAAGPLVNASSLAMLQSGPRERLRVVTHFHSDDAPQLFSMLHGVPLLLVESRKTRNSLNQRIWLK